MSGKIIEEYLSNKKESINIDDKWEEVKIKTNDSLNGHTIKKYIKETLKMNHERLTNNHET